VAVVKTPGTNRSFQYRVATAGTTTATNATAGTANWVRLTRNGDSFTAFHSVDGTTWTQVGTAQTITMGTSVRIGLCVTSHNTAALSTAVFDNVTVTP
jgi:regulation of enolase protein 1 (concanavalin A-like superfamily)